MSEDRKKTDECLHGIALRSGCNAAISFASLLLAEVEKERDALREQLLDALCELRRYHTASIYVHPDAYAAAMEHHVADCKHCSLLREMQK